MHQRDMQIGASRVRLIGIAGILVLIVLSLTDTLVQAQTAAETPSPASPRVSFDVASIKLADPEKFTPPNFALDFLDSFSGADPHGRFVAQFPLRAYVGFAYKLFPYTQEQNDAMLARVPKWVSTDQYAINAKAEGDPTKD